MKILKREPSNTLERTEMWTVQPDGYDQNYLVTVTRPAMPVERPHGLILTDGNYVAGTAMQLMYFLELGNLVPSNVVVSIGFPLDNPTPPMVARNQDLTPSAWPEWDASYGKILKLDCPRSGDCDRFRTFIVDELKPAIEAEYGVDSAEWTLGGHSLGGLFATHTLLSTPHAFKRYFAVGSSFWWRYPAMFDLAKQFAASAQERDISVYLAAGDKESWAALKAEWSVFSNSPEWQEYLAIMGEVDLVEEAHDMAAVLAACPGLRVKAETFPNETHGTAPFVALSQGLRWLYGR